MCGQHPKGSWGKFSSYNMCPGLTFNAFHNGMVTSPVVGVYMIIYAHYQGFSGCWMSIPHLYPQKGDLLSNLPERGCRTGHVEFEYMLYAMATNFRERRWDAEKCFPPLKYLSVV